MGEKAMKKMIKVLCLVVVLLIAGNLLISPVMGKAVMEKPVITSGPTICNSDYVRVSAEISGAWTISMWNENFGRWSKIETTYTVELKEDIPYWPDKTIATKDFIHRMELDGAGVKIYRQEDGVTYRAIPKSSDTVEKLMHHLDDAPIAKLTISDSDKYYVKVKAHLEVEGDIVDPFGWGIQHDTNEEKSDTIQINVVGEPYPSLEYKINIIDSNNDGYLNRNEQFYVELSSKVGISDSPIAYITFSNSEGLEYDHMKVIVSTSSISVNHVEAGGEIWPKNEHFPLNGDILNPKITAQYALTDIIIQPCKVGTNNKIRVYFKATSYGTEWFTFRFTVKTPSSSKIGNYINIWPPGDEYLKDQQGYEATKMEIHVTEKDLPIFFENFKPAGWVSDNTPDCSIGVADLKSGLDVSTAEYQYSTNGGSSWSDWKHASCTESGGTMPTHTITAREVPFNQDSKDKNKMKFRIKDKVGNTGTSNVHTVKIDGTRPKTDCTFSPSSPDGENDWYISPVTITLESNDATSGIEWIKYRIDSGSWQIYSGSKVSFTVSNDGFHYITYYAKDKADNEEQQKLSDIFYIDKTKPSASISINNGVECTNSRSVTLYLSCSDATSGVKDCRYKNEGESGASWESCSLTKSWTLTAGEGTKKVYYQVRDNAGNIKEVYDTIVSKQKGSIYATSNPSGANVYLDGTYKGISPITISNVPVGSHTVKYTKSGYYDCSKTVTVNADQQTNVHCDLVVIPQKGSIYATSNPSGANVYLDGTYKGTSPITISNVPVGSHTVKYTKSGYYDCSKAVTVNADQQTNVHCDLVVIPQKGSIYATSNPSGANVYLDGTYKGTSPITISNVPVGSHTVKYTKSGYYDCSKAVTVNADQQTNVHCDLVVIPQKGSIYATSNPSGANVYLDGTYKGTSPITISNVPVGSHTVKYTKSGYYDCSKAVTVNADQQTNVHCDLVVIPQKGSIYATSNPSGANVYLDGTYKGISPITISNVPVGSHTVKYTKSGYEDCEKTATIYADQQTNVHCDLVVIPQKGSIYATSNPSGANVYLDGTYKGTSPITISNVPVGSHTVKYTKSGYYDCSKAVTVNADQQTNVHCDLVVIPQKGSIYATSNPSGANVYLDGTYKGTSPITISNVPVGSHTVKYTKSGYYDCSKTVTVNADQQTNVHCDLVVIPQKGSIYATSNPSGANVYLDGTYKGTSPITISNVPVGSHTVKYTKSGYYDCSKAVTVNADQQTNVHCDLVVIPQKGSIYATSNPSGANVYLDGTYKGISPITISNVPVGSHTVKYTKSGYEDCEKTVTVYANQQTNVHCDLVVIPQKGSIYATSNPSGANVYLDGTYKGTSPITISNVPVGSHTVKYTKSGYYDCSKAVTVNADQQTNVHCDLVVIPQKGSIYATSNPSGANVYLDGTYKGTSPITISNVPVGSHTVKYTKSGYYDCSKAVTVNANQQTNVHCDLQSITQKCKVQITSHSSLQDRPSIVYANGNYYVAYQSWEKGRGIFIKKFDSQWNFKKKKEVVSGSAYYDSPSLAFANNKLYVAYVSNEKGANANDYDVIVKEYDPNSLSCTKGAKYLTSLQSCQDLPSLLYKDGYFYLAYQSWEKGNGDIFIKKFDSSWNLKKKVQVTSKSSYQDRPSIIYANSYFYVAYFSKETGNYDIFVKRLDSNLKLDSWKKQITSESSSQSYPFITFVNNEYAIVYASNEGGTLGIFMKKYDSNWNFIGKTKVVDDSSANERRPSHVWDGSNYWVAYVYNYGESNDWNIFAIIPGCEGGASPTPTPTPSPSCCPSMSISTGLDTYMPGDNVYVSITLTGRSGCTFQLNSPSIVSLIAPTGETVIQTDMAQGITSSIASGGHHTIGRSMKLPLNAPLGRYDVKVSLSGGKCTKTANGLFLVVTA